MSYLHRNMRQPRLVPSLRSRIFSAGFTLIEIIIVLCLVSVMSLMSLYFVMDMMQVYVTRQSSNALLEEARHTMRLISNEVRSASAIQSPALPIAGAPPNTAMSITFDQVYPGQDPQDVIYSYDVNSSSLTRRSDIQASSLVAEQVSAFSISRDAYNVVSIDITFDNDLVRPITLNTSVRPRGFSIY